MRYDDKIIPFDEERRRETARRNEPQYRNASARNIDVRRSNVGKIKNGKLKSRNKYIAIAAAGVLTFSAAVAGISNIDNKTEDVNVVETDSAYVEQIQSIGIEDCHFDEMYFIIRTAKPQTKMVSEAATRELEGMGAKVEEVGPNDNWVDTVREVRDFYPDREIVIINVENGSDYTDEASTMIMTDAVNGLEHTGDTLAACMETSSEEYHNSAVVVSGVKDSSGSRRETSIASKLTEAGLDSYVTHITINLPDIRDGDLIEVGDQASTIAEGCARYASIDRSERHTDIYHVVNYGDTLSSIASHYGVSVGSISGMNDLGNSSNIHNKQTLRIASMPTNARSTTLFDNPVTVDNINNSSYTTITYVIEPGDTYIGIEDKLNITGLDLIQIDDQDNIYSGEELTIRIPDTITSPKIENDKTNGRTM